MSEKCALCGQRLPVPPDPADRRGVITDEHELLAILTERAEREIYRSEMGSWHYTNAGKDRRRVAVALIHSLIRRGTLRPVYSNTRDAYWLGRTIDINATLAARRMHGKKADLVYEATP
jgi:hypothetical protein